MLCETEGLRVRGGGRLLVSVQLGGQALLSVCEDQVRQPWEESFEIFAFLYTLRLKGVGHRPKRVRDHETTVARASKAYYDLQNRQHSQPHTDFGTPWALRSVASHRVSFVLSHSGFGDGRAKILVYDLGNCRGW